MNLIVDIIHNSIIISSSLNKRSESFNFVKEYESPFSNPDNIVNAINDAINADIIDKFQDDRSNSVVLGDDLVAFGIEQLPVLSKSKVADIFDTRFKMYFPNYQDYFVKAFEMERNSDYVKYFYSLAKRQSVNKILNAIRAKTIEIKNIDYYGNVFVRQRSNVDFPIATLMVGKYQSEIFISKGNQVFAISILPMGENELFAKEGYLTSSYNLSNDESLKFAACVKANFAANLALTDEKILSYEKEDGLSFSIPREFRAIKGASLENYILKNNFRKFTTSIADFIDNYSQSPWFMPIQEIVVYGNDEILEHLNSSAEDTPFKFVKANVDLAFINFVNVEHNDLFTQEFKKERRKIDWAKFLTMEIGKKKKA